MRVASDNHHPGSTGERRVVVDQPAIVFAGQRIHMIGIGGSGMRAAARVLLQLGAVVTGSDQQPFEGMGELVGGGAVVSIGHSESQSPSGVELVVISAAIPADNPELVAARERKVPVIGYAELLGEIMAVRDGVAVAGTHGKSTTTAMCAHIFREAGLSPSYVVGARSDQLGGGGSAGSGRHFIVESCEFNRSFLHLRPNSAAILNIESDHPDCFADVDDIVEAFRSFSANVDPEGLLVCNAEDDLAVKAARSARGRVVTFGFGEDADWQVCELLAKGGLYSFEVRFRGKFVLKTQLMIPGLYNVANAVAAVALADEAGIAPEVIAGALASFAGVDRRLTLRGQGRGITILDDYAHHPTEIRVTLEAVVHCYSPKRMWVVFQPHQYLRTKRFMEEFAGSFELADEVVISDVFLARERPGKHARRGAKQLVSRIHQRGGKARYLSSLDTVTEHLLENLREGDVVMTMGAGDVWKVADGLVARICPAS